MIFALTARVDNKFNIENAVLQSVDSNVAGHLGQAIIRNKQLQNERKRLSKTKRDMSLLVLS